MKILYEDDLYPDDRSRPQRSDKYRGKTIGQILLEHPNPRAFIKSFNRSNKFCLSDGIAIDTQWRQRR